MEQLLPQHQQLIAASGIEPAVAAERQYRSVTSRVELQRLGFGEAQRQTPALLIPIWSVTGEIATYQSRPDRPRLKDDKPIKYETPGGTAMRLDLPPRARAWAQDPARPLFITEGVRKADAAVSRGLCCLALLGVWNWRGTNEWGGKTALSDWESIALAERQLYLVFASDVMLKPPVHAALARLKAFLESRGGRVALIYLPAGDGAAKVGLDDFLAAGHSVDDLLALATPALRPLPEAEMTAGGEPRYQETPAGLFWERPAARGALLTRLTNFTARICREIVEDDGAETHRLFEVEACCRERTHRFYQPAVSFDSMAWVTEQLGAHALIYPGPGLKDHARAAIRLLSAGASEQRVYIHTGWQRLEPGCWVYLHGGGAISGEGVKGDEVTGRDSADLDPAGSPLHPFTPSPLHPFTIVRLPEALAGMALPAPPEGEERAAALRDCLALLALGPPALMYPLVATIWRAALGGGDFSAALVGPSGVFKTELAALAQQHFGAGLDARHLPGSWSSTDNALEGLAFTAKDALLVIDDFAPAGAPADIQRLHARADRLLRAQGNHAGRQRMRADGTLRPPKPPRGLILITGEDVPQGHSLRSRMLILEVAPDDIAVERLTACQRAAAAGRYAQAMAAFLAWLAPDYEAVQRMLPGEGEQLRAKAMADRQHRRTPGITAHLGVGLRYLFTFCRDAGVLSAAEAEEWWEQGWRALTEAAGRQTAHQAASEPAQRFLELLAAALASGRAHLAGRTGQAPENPAAWGWRQEGDHREWRPQGARIGWVEGEDLYLIPDEACACVRRMSADNGEGLTLGTKTLSKRLHERGLLLSTDPTHGTLTVRRNAEGRRHEVLHLECSTLSLTESPQSPQSPHEEGVQTFGRSGVQAFGTDEDKHEHESECLNACTRERVPAEPRNAATPPAPAVLGGQQ